MSITLIQFISDQPMPNLFPILALNPDKVIHLYTAQTRSISSNIWKSLPEECACSFQEVELRDLTSLDSISKTVMGLIESDPDSEYMINITGGTKLMSLSGFYASIKNKVLSFYLDYQTGGYIIVNPSQKKELMELFSPDLRTIHDQIDIKTILEAHGNIVLNSKLNYLDYYPLAKLLLDNESERVAMFAELSKLFPSRIPDSYEELVKIIEKKFTLHPLFRDELVNQNIVEKVPSDEESEYFQLPIQLIELLKTNPENKKHRRLIQNEVEFHLNLLFGGAWWEIIVAESVSNIPSVQELLWSAVVRCKPDKEGNSNIVEEDIIARIGAKLINVSCKTSNAGGYAQIHELASRSKSMGGITVKAVYATVRSNDHHADLAKALHIAYITPETLGSLTLA